jgi:ankyrin repeat protein
MSGSDPNRRDQSADQLSRDARTALMLAAENGYIGVAKLLLERGADVNIGDNRGWTALHIAAARNHVDIIQELLIVGADATAINEDARTPFACAALRGHLKAMGLLSKYGSA